MSILKYRTLESISAKPIPVYNIDKYGLGIGECRNNTPIITITTTIM